MAPLFLPLLFACNTPPVADAGGDKTAPPGEEVIFDGSGSMDDDGAIAGYSWDFGDGTAPAEGVKVTHVYEEKGRYGFTLTVRDEEGREGSDGGVALITHPPHAEAGSDMTGMVDHDLTFDGSSSFDPDGEIVRYAWDFGDGGEGDGSVASHIYEEEGEYMATLVVEDDTGVTATDTASVLIYPGGYAWWTFMVYMNADNNLEYAGVIDLNEMEVAGSTEMVNIVVQFDRIAGYDSSNGDWTGCRRYHVTRDSDTRVINSALMEDMGECDMGDPSTFASFFEWGMENFPAVRYGLIFWDHGEGWRLREGVPGGLLKGFSIDETDYSEMSIAGGDLEDALSEIYSIYGRRFELLGFDACLMQMWEVGYVAKDYTSYMVASEASESYAGWPYDTLFSSVIENPLIDGEEAGNIIGATFHTTGDSTMSTVELSKFYRLSELISGFAETLMAEDKRDEIVEIVLDTLQMDAWFGYRDLYDFVLGVSNLPLSLSSATKGEELILSIEDTVTSNYVNWYEGAGGISIYLPSYYFESIYATEPGARWAQETKWDEFLAYLYP